MILRVEGLRHTYPDAARPVLDAESITLSGGEQILLRGVSGSGKTTLFNILAGLLRPTAGAIYYDDGSLYNLSEAARDRFRAQHIGYVFQTHHLIPSLTALENVVMPLAFARATPPGTWRTAARDGLDRVGLADLGGRYPRQLSTGQRLRVAVARALATRPRVLLADEPTAALDDEAGVVVMDLLQTTCAAHDAILIVASHDPALVERFERRADLRAGHLMWAERMLA
ncbi:MAG: ABC transporter ATP-binding protein [Chloroflexota bacterium]|nr:ABC transporter ATP-binding protein [Chloroflexota bacterium]